MLVHIPHQFDQLGSAVLLPAVFCRNDDAFGCPLLNKVFHLPFIFQVFDRLAVFDSVQRRLRDVYVPPSSSSGICR